jgi:PST family polysaccharide transporter
MYENLPLSSGPNPTKKVSFNPMQLTKKIKSESLILLILSLFQKIMELLTIIILSRLLQPEEFGLFGLAFAINGLIAVIGSLGIGLFIVYEKDISGSLLSFAFWLNIGISIILMLTALMTASALSTYFELPGLRPILYLLALSIFFNACGTVHLALLQKNLNFKIIGIIQATITILGSIISIALAIRGWGVYSFVIPVVISSALFSICYWIFQKWRPEFQLDFKFTRPIINYGKHIFLADANSYIIQNAGYIIIGKYLSLQALGYFKFSFSLAMALVFLFNDLANKLIMPLYIYLKQNSELIKEIVVKIFQYLAVFSIPAFTGLMILARDLIVTVFGEKWMPAVPAFRILCLMGMFVVISRPVPAILNAFGRPDIRSVYSMIFLPFIIIFSLLSVTRGLEVFVLVYSLANIIFVMATFIKSMHVIDLRWWQVIKQLGFILIPVALMIGSMYGFQILRLLRPDHIMIYVFFQIVIGITAFIASFRIFNRKTFNNLYRPIADLRRVETI